MFRSLVAVLFAAVLALSVAACGESRGYTRGMFHGLVIDKTEDEVISKMGKPVEVETTGAEAKRFIYHGKTFDPDNLNTVDHKTFVEFERKDGKMIVVDVTFG